MPGENYTAAFLSPAALRLGLRLAPRAGGDWDVYCRESRCGSITYVARPEYGASRWMEMNRGHRYVTANRAALAVYRFWIKEG